MALVVALLAAGRNIYRKLPAGDGSFPNRANPSQTQLRIVMQAPLEGAAKEVPIKLYPVDVASVRREYFMEHRAGVRFDDFLTQRMNGRSPVTVTLDERGQAIVTVTPGTWWIYATARGAEDEDTEWRLRVNVAGNEQTVELTPANAYARMKSF